MSDLVQRKQGEPAARMAELTQGAASAVEVLAKRLTEMGAKKFSFTPGSNPNATPDQIAAEINKALDQIESGAASATCGGCGGSGKEIGDAECPPEGICGECAGTGRAWPEGAASSASGANGTEPTKQQAVAQALAELEALSPDELRAELEKHKGKLRLEVPDRSPAVQQVAGQAVVGIDDSDRERLLYAARVLRGIADQGRSRPLGDLWGEAVMACGAIKRVLNIKDEDCAALGLEATPAPEQESAQVAPPGAQEVSTLAEALADRDGVPYLIVFDDADRAPELVIGGTRALYRFKELSASWNAHLFARIASNSCDDKTPCYTAPVPATTPAEQTEQASSQVHPDSALPSKGQP